MKATTEQQAALDAFLTGDQLVIEAGAGTGKTTTLRLLAEQAKGRGQYLAFNKSIVTEAGSKMPGTVTCSTAHSLAYRAVGKRFGDRLRNSRRMRSQEIARTLRIDPMFVDYDTQRKVLQPHFLAGHVMRAVVNFCHTADAEPDLHHIGYIDGIDFPNPDGSRTCANNNVVRQALLGAVRKAWQDLQVPTGSLPYRHDHYLKAWQLSDPRIYADYILFDEAQDANPVMQAIVLAQTHAQLVWVGDSQQQIYGFTGAVNALANLGDGVTRTFLTQSWRFGNEVAGQANILLEMLNADLRLKGHPDLASVVGSVPDPDCILSRTNAAAVTEVLRRQQAGQRVHLLGGGTEVVMFAKAADQLKATGWSAHPDLACFTNWPEVQDYVQHDAQGKELKLLVNLVDEFGTDMIVEALDRQGVPEAGADVVISTAHKAKGREWASVQLAADFPEDKGEGVEDEELRLLYVGATRAQMELDIDRVGLLNPGEPQDAAQAASAPEMAR